MVHRGFGQVELVFKVLRSEKHLVYYYLVQVGHISSQMVKAGFGKFSSFGLVVPAVFRQFVWDMLEVACHGVLARRGEGVVTQGLSYDKSP